MKIIAPVALLLPLIYITLLLASITTAVLVSDGQLGDRRCKNSMPKLDIDTRQSLLPNLLWYFNPQKQLCLVFASYSGNQKWIFQKFFVSQEECETACHVAATPTEILLSACVTTTAIGSDCRSTICPQGLECTPTLDTGQLICCNTTLNAAMVESFTVECEDGVDAYVLHNASKPLSADDCQTIYCPSGYHCEIGKSSMVAKCCSSDRIVKKLVQQRSAQKKTINQSKTLAEYSSQTAAQSCLQEKNPGYCSNSGEDQKSAAVIRWFYSKTARRCLAFTYYNCGGNANNFATKQRCELECRKDGTIDNMEPDAYVCANGLQPLQIDGAPGLGESCNDLLCPRGMECMKAASFVMCCPHSSEGTTHSSPAPVSQIPLNAASTKLNSILCQWTQAHNLLGICPSAVTTTYSSVTHPHDNLKPSPESENPTPENQTPHIAIGESPVSPIVTTTATSTAFPLSTVSVWSCPMQLVDRQNECLETWRKIRRNFIERIMLPFQKDENNNNDNSLNNHNNHNTEKKKRKKKKKKANDAEESKINEKSHKKRSPSTKQGQRREKPIKPDFSEVQGKHQKRRSERELSNSTKNETAINIISPKINNRSSKVNTGFSKNNVSSTIIKREVETVIQQRNLSDDNGGICDEFENLCYGYRNYTICSAPGIITSGSHTDQNNDQNLVKTVTSPSECRFATLEEHVISDALALACEDRRIGMEFAACLLRVLESEAGNQCISSVAEGYESVSEAAFRKMEARKYHTLQHCLSDEIENVCYFSEPSSHRFVATFLQRKFNHSENTKSEIRQSEQSTDSSTTNENVGNAQMTLTEPIRTSFTSLTGLTPPVEPDPESKKPVPVPEQEYANAAVAKQVIIKQQLKPTVPENSGTEHLQNQTETILPCTSEQQQQLDDCQKDLRILLRTVTDFWHFASMTNASCDLFDQFVTCSERAEECASRLPVHAGVTAFFRQLCAAAPPIGNDASTLLASSCQGTEQLANQEAPCKLNVVFDSLMSGGGSACRDAHEYLRCSEYAIANSCGAEVQQVISSAIIAFTTAVDENCNVEQGPRPEAARVSTGFRYTVDLVLGPQGPPEPSRDLGTPEEENPSTPQCNQKEQRRIATCSRDFLQDMAPITVLKDPTGLKMVCNSYAAANSCIGSSPCSTDSLTGFRSLLPVLCSEDGRRNYEAHNSCWTALRSDPVVLECVKPFQHPNIRSSVLSAVGMCSAVDKLLQCVRRRVLSICTEDAYKLIVLFHTIFLQDYSSDCKLVKAIAEPITASCAAPLWQLFRPISILQSPANLDDACDTYQHVHSTCKQQLPNSKNDAYFADNVTHKLSVAVLDLFGTLCQDDVMTKERFLRTGFCIAEVAHSKTGQSCLAAYFNGSFQEHQLLQSDVCERMQNMLACVSRRLILQCGVEAIEALTRLHQPLTSVQRLGHPRCSLAENIATTTITIKDVVNFTPQSEFTTQELVLSVQQSQVQNQTENAEPDYSESGDIVQRITTASTTIPDENSEFVATNSLENEFTEESADDVLAIQKTVGQFRQHLKTTVVAQSDEQIITQSTPTNENTSVTQVSSAFFNCSSIQEARIDRCRRNFFEFLSIIGEELSVSDCRNFSSIRRAFQGSQGGEDTPGKGTKGIKGNGLLRPVCHKLAVLVSCVRVAGDCALSYADQAALIYSNLCQQPAPSSNLSLADCIATVTKPEVTAQCSTMLSLLGIDETPPATNEFPPIDCERSSAYALCIAPSLRLSCERQSEELVQFAVDDLAQYFSARCREVSSAVLQLAQLAEKPGLMPQTNGASGHAMPQSRHNHQQSRVNSTVLLTDDNDNATTLINRTLNANLPHELSTNCSSKETALLQRCRRLLQASLQRKAYGINGTQHRSALTSDTCRAVQQYAACISTVTCLQSLNVRRRIQNFLQRSSCLQQRQQTQQQDKQQQNQHEGDKQEQQRDFKPLSLTQQGKCAALVARVAAAAQNTTIDAYRAINVVGKRDVANGDLKSDWPTAIAAAVLNQSAHGNYSTRLPRCHANGHFEKLQCDADTGQCWCVDEVEGVELPDTRTLPGGSPPLCYVDTLYTCERLPWRAFCPNEERRPQGVMRWFHDNGRCRMYLHSYCNSDASTRIPPLTIRYKSDCFRLCLHRNVTEEVEKNGSIASASREEPVYND